jgi:hypothetical protein
MPGEGIASSVAQRMIVPIGHQHQRLLSSCLL